MDEARVKGAFAYSFHDSLTLTLFPTEQQPLTHKTLTFAIDLPSLRRGGLLRFRGRADVDSNTVLFLRYLDADMNSISDDASKIRIFLDHEEHLYAINLMRCEAATRLEIGIYQDRNVAAVIFMSDFEIFSGDGIFGVTSSGLVKKSDGLTKTWHARDNRLYVTCELGSFYCEFPSKFNLNAITDNQKYLAEYLLFGPIEEKLFGINSYEHYQKLMQPISGVAARDKSVIMHAFSGGADSVAAAALLPKNTINYYCERVSDTYRLSNGARIKTQNQSVYFKIIEKFGALRIKNNFEHIGLAAGERHGFRHGLGYGAVGILLSHLFGGNTLSFGAALEVIMMQSGYRYIDPVSSPNSKALRMKNLFASGGFALAYPVAGCSEYINAKISDQVGGRFVVSCPNEGEDYKPCGACFKCFRKLAFLGQASRPSQNVINSFEKKPMKLWPTVILSVQKSGFKHPNVQRLTKLDLSFLERYFDLAIDIWLPHDVRIGVRERLATFGFSPMNKKDIENWKKSGEFFASEIKYSEEEFFELEQLEANDANDKAYP